MNADLMMMMAPFFFALTIAVAALVISRRDEKAYYERKAKGLVGTGAAGAPPREPTQAELVRRRIFGGAQATPAAMRAPAGPADTAPKPPPAEGRAPEAPKPPQAVARPDQAEVPPARPTPSTPLRLAAGGLTVVRRWTVRPDLEEAFERAWGELTGELRAEHGLDTAWLHRAEDGSYVATESWSSAEAYGRERTLQHATAAALLQAAGDSVHPPLVLSLRAAAAD